jgi:hypothetical protein
MIVMCHLFRSHTQNQIPLFEAQNIIPMGDYGPLLLSVGFKNCNGCLCVCVWVGGCSIVVRREGHKSCRRSSVHAASTA